MAIEIRKYLPQEPWQGPPLPEFLNIYWFWHKPEVPVAKFTVTNLIISSKEIQLGQSVDISCLVTNMGSILDSYAVVLGGDFVAEKTVTLEPGESTTVSFTVTPTEAKS